ncbi:MAG: molybdopterin-dependent oxidoreductase [Desulfomonile tiedjei]|uniref:Molybdopterin-dependent oxidoreductase n=1 Tax=Desulfomonile tiedjei TaxID=2358 RepID=A0A9D6Z5W8_9BACT|nr:molybdopterin-dependent oxidoreductase [Desulfomonile tiedjei]
MVTLTIDGVEVTVQRGATILEAAQKAGVRIPTLCNDKRLIPFGACRLCMVEVTARGRTRTMPACFNPARDGMQVATHTPQLIESRRMQLKLLLRAHPLLCPSCDAAGDCELQNLVHEYQITELPFTRETRFFHVDHTSHFIRFNMNLCIRCGMCVRVCDEIQGQNELSFVNRGMHSEISTDFGRPLNCEFCGQCASICPVGAIRSKWLVGTGRPFEMQDIDTTCAFCSLGCTLTLGRKDGKIVYVTSPKTSPNEGNLCVKGRYGWPYIYSSGRLLKPMIRKDGVLKEVEWNEALGFVSEGLKKVKAESGGTSLAALGSERLTNEEAYVFNRFARTVLGTPHIDHAGGYGYRALVDGLAKSLGYPASTNSIREIRNSKVILLLGSDLTETHPVAKNEVIIATGRNRAKAIVVDSIRTKLTDRPGLFLWVPPGTEHLIAHAMLKHIIDQELFDKAGLNSKAEGFEELTASLADYTPEKVAEATGVDAELIREAATEYAKAPTATIILTEGLNRIGNSVELAIAAVNLALVTGRIGKESCGVHVFGEKVNAQGAIDMGLAPDLLPGFASISDDAARAKFEDAWAGPISKERGYSAAEIFVKAEQGEIKGLYVVGENPADVYPDRALIEKALSKLDFLVVQDMFLSSTAQLAHAVLPVASFAEKSGTFTSAERLVQRIRPVVHSQLEKSDLDVFVALAALMSKPAMNYSGPEQVMEEIAGLVKIYEGISYERLDAKGLQWPCVDAEDPGKRILYEGGFPGGKAHLEPAAPQKKPDLDGLPMYMILGTVKFHSGSFSMWSSALMDVCPDAYAEMSWKDIRALGLKEGDQIKITDASGVSVQTQVKFSRRAMEGMVVVPFHFSGLKLNNLTHWDKPVVKVKVEKA